ncbi:TspO/MBR family protein [Labrenzia sp. 011]|uniref:TspO/MBR family protein n=1 Tax=Labrenzia sp. 011 TaxID=2171494 RepID=UPI000D51F4A7|nr:TspO/MBR family protein [Labrenzia sp. 011]PVB63265.1 sensor histidine kinase [Labrenzia sp. 011]
MKTSEPLQPARRPLLTLGLFIVGVVGIGILIGTLSAPGPWYEALRKPPFNPPNWIFAPVWTVIYVLIAIAGWRIYRFAPGSLLMGVWGVQMLFNWAWTPVFFSLQQIWAAFAVIVLLFALVLIFIIRAWNADRMAALLFLPYAAWVAFAGLLNLSIAVLN